MKTNEEILDKWIEREFWLEGNPIKETILLVMREVQEQAVDVYRDLLDTTLYDKHCNMSTQEHRHKLGEQVKKKLIKGI